MKKYITIAALLAAGSTLASAAETIDLITTGDLSPVYVARPGAIDMSWTLGGYNKTSIVDVLSSDVVTCLGNKEGWVYGCGSGNTSLPEYGKVVISYEESDGAEFTLTGRPAYSGAYVALVLSVEDLLGVSNRELTEISLSFNAEGANAGEFSAWSISEGSAKQLGADISLTNKSSSVKYSDLSLDAGDKIAFLFNTQNQGGGSQIKISSFKGTAIVIPEPSSFGLLASLGALALVGARRRRR